MQDSNARKKILVLNGSPKKEASTTMTVTRSFVDGMRKADEFDVEYVNIADLNIKQCMGCLSCWGRTPGECVIKDDAAVLKQKIAEADYVIESYPLFFFGMPGGMKVFTDRMLGMMCTYTGQESPENGDSFHRVRSPREGRKLVVISSCAFTEGEDVYGSLKKQYDMICGKDRYTAIFCPQLKTLVDLGQSNRLSRYLSKFEEAGRIFACQGALDEKTVKTLSQPPFTHETYKVLLAHFWQNEKERGIHD